MASNTQSGKTPDTAPDKVVISAPTPPAPLFDWIAIVYFPDKQPQPRSHIHQLLGTATQMPLPAYSISIGLPPESTADRTVGSAKDGRSIFLNPGTNLGVSRADWEKVKDHRLIAPKLESGVLQVYEPTEYKNIKEPRYCHFKPDVAIELIKNTLHEDWIDRWIGGETDSARAEVATSSRNELVRIKANRAAAA